MTYTQARWRLQLLSELGVGTLLREQGRAEDSRFKRLKETTRGAG